MYFLCAGKYLTYETDPNHRIVSKAKWVANDDICAVDDYCVLRELRDHDILDITRKSFHVHSRRPGNRLHYEIYAKTRLRPLN